MKRKGLKRFIRTRLITFRIETFTKIGIKMDACISMSESLH